jgi:pyruvate/2-oxoglutarate/acetoin dehydrogenase E1 component
MTELGKIDNTIFIGQQLIWHGNPMSTTVSNVPKEKMIEVPVMEESQMGMSLGLAMAGKTVITFYPRWDFLICATNQLVNHVDKIKLMSNDTWEPHILIRVGKGSDKPLDPGHQHKGNYFEQFKSMCPNIEFYNLKSWQDVELSYTYATNNKGIYCLVEYPELY